MISMFLGKPGSGMTLNACTPPTDKPAVSAVVVQPVGLSGVCAICNQKNRAQWLSIAEFLKIDPLVKLGLPGGWAAGASGTRQGAADCGPESIIPFGNHGDNNFRTSEVVR